MIVSCQRVLKVKPSKYSLESLAEVTKKKLGLYRIREFSVQGPITDMEMARQ